MLAVAPRPGLVRFNEAEALKPRIHHRRDSSMWEIYSFNEAEALKPRILRFRACLRSWSDPASMRPRH